MAISKLKLKQGKYSVVRISDNSGDSGPILMSLDENGDQVGDNGELHVGCNVQCGSIYARTFQQQDYWLTTEITEIFDVNEDKTYAKFKTKNSLYEVESF